MDKKTNKKNVKVNNKTSDYNVFRTDEKRKNKKKSKIKVFFSILILAIILIYAIYLVAKLVKNPTNTFIVTNGKISQEESKIGYIVREETVVKGKNYKKR